MVTLNNLNNQLYKIVSKCQQSEIGKLLPSAFYVHHSALNFLDEELQSYEEKARQKTTEAQHATLVKFSLDQPTISYLFYPDFDSNPHPVLEASIQVNLVNQDVNRRDYREYKNPPILHRKETFVTPEYPLYEKFAQLTFQEETLGLLGNSRYIGTRDGWQRRLKHHRVKIIEHRLVCSLEGQATEKLAIARHRAAIVRGQISRPVKLAMESGVLTSQTSFFDYGCGHGGDVERLTKQGYTCGGWDPHYFPDTKIQPADVVNLGYIINVIEDTKERREALINAWGLTKQVLIVSAQVFLDDGNRGAVIYGDGVVTKRSTFQKYYEQEELKLYVDQVLGVDSIPAALGVYFVFRDETQAQNFRASQFYSSTRTPIIRRKQKNFEDYEELLTPLMNFVTKRGRLPVKGELATEAEIKEEFRSFRSAFKVILQVTEKEEWEAITEKRRQDFLVYLALSNFGHRPKMRKLAKEVREDIKALFGTYKQACLIADMMLLSLRDRKNIADLCHSSSVGKKRKDAFLFHISILDSLDPLLRLYEGCASRNFGRLESANVIKFHLGYPKISYLFFPDFETETKPVLHSRMRVDLRDLSTTYRKFERSNAPVLEGKEALFIRSQNKSITEQRYDSEN